GYIREWGAEQLVRDVRISQIYEGTNGIQALDLIDRKLRRDGGSAMAEFLGIARTAAGPHAEALRTEVERLERVNAFILEGARSDDCLSASVACDYLELAGLVVFAWLWQRAAGASTGDTQADRERLAAAGFYFARLLPRAESLERVILSGSAPLRQTLGAS
ncbi:MAG: acyl-CoA dehydrogenase C-terminal domain-containing protein, partial [Gammaproteobacteria bacterium AqS3]|nr:acyl-CoA dehydrogenase C-terminal domain-containing protein [Gammaproteobacteria bacterium AqS3]